MQPPDFGDVDDDTRQSLELAWRLQQEEQARMQEHAAAAERLQNEPEDAESIALAIRLQQEDDEQALRNALGVMGGDDGSEPGSPSQYSYEQLMRLSETVGEVNRGASEDDINKLRTMTYEEACKDSNIILGEQCAICRMEFEADDELRVLRCGHAEHAECIDQWLAVNKSCPLCQTEIIPSPSGVASHTACTSCSPAAVPMALASPTAAAPAVA